MSSALQRRCLQAFTLVLLLCVLQGAAIPADAHAVLASAEPSPNQILPSTPLRVRLLLTEELDPAFSTLRVTDTAGGSVSEGPARIEADGRTLVIDLQILPDGVYTVHWRALSASDGHVTEGTYGFGVGDVRGAIAPPSGTTLSEARTGGASAVLLRGLIYVGAALAIGPALFLAVPWRFGLQDPQGGLRAIADRTLRGRLRSMAPWQEIDRSLLGPLPGDGPRPLALPRSLRLRAQWVVWSLAAVGATIGATAAILLVVLSAELVGTSLTGFLLDSRSGNLLGAASAGLWLTAGLTLGYARTSKELRGLTPILGALPALGTLGALALHSHAAGVEPLWGPMVAFVHLTAVTAWTGSLCALVLVPLALRRAAKGKRSLDVGHLTLAVAARYASVAASLAGVTVLSGVLLLVLVLGPLPTLLAILLDPLGTLYVLLLDAKLALVAVLLGLGALHHLVLLPALATQVTSPRERGRRIGRRNGGGIDRTVALEATGAVVLLLLVGALVQQSPTRSDVDTTPTSRTLILHQSADELLVELQVFPANPLTVGFQSLTVSATRQGAPFTAIRAIDLEFLGPSSLVPEVNRTTADGQGHYLTSGGFLRTTGEWLVTAKVRRTDSADTFAAFVLQVQPPPVSDVPVYQGMALAFERPAEVHAEVEQELTFTLRDALSGARITGRHVDLFVQQAPTGLSGTPEAFESPTILPGQSWELQVTQPVSAIPVRFHDHLHSSAEGNFSVTSSADAPAVVELEVTEAGFSPADFTIAADGTIVLTNRGATPHAMNYGSGHPDVYTIPPVTADEVSPGRYRAHVEFPKAGHYIIEVRVDTLRGIFFFLQEVGDPRSALPAGEGLLALTLQYGAVLGAVLGGLVLVRARLGRARARKRAVRALARRSPRR